MSLHESADVESIGTTETETDDAPTTLEPQITMIVTDHVANGPADGELLGYAEFCAVTTVVTDTIARVVQESEAQ